MKEIGSLRNIIIDKSVLEKVPVKFAGYYKFMPLKIEGELLTIAVSQPLDIKISDEIRLHFGFDIETVLSTSEEIMEAIRKNYGLAAETVGGLITQQPMGVEEDREEKIEEIEKEEEASVIKLVNQIFLEAYKKRATDIHIEPYRRKLSLRYRIDGVLYETNVPSQMKQFLNPILSRIKIMANLNIVERRLPQDGRTIVKVGGHNLDLRISTIPTPFGESVVIRILPATILFDLEKLGVEGGNLKVIENLLKRPYGIIFLTGPTGSGKTTTLYSFLSRLNQPQRKIITVEDPIEYEIEGITQIQIKPEISLTFARILRNILRHDPDMIMIGEVRDQETAEIAIRLALTGHLVFSTLHTNDAAGGITRLVDMGIEPYLIASSVEGFIAQRLVRVICPKCKQPDSEQPEEIRKQIKEELNLEAEATIYKGGGCEACNYTGFIGRQAIYEILPLSSEIKKLILRKVSSEEIKNRAVLSGMRTLREDGLRRAAEGVTTIEEVMKVTPAKELNYRAKTRLEKTQERAPLAEKRVYPRLKKEIPIRYRLFPPQEAEKIQKALREASTKNISAGGILFELSSPIAVESIIEVTINLPEAAEPIVCLAKVVRIEALAESTAYDIAICFLDIQSGDRKRLEKYVIRYL